MNANTVLCIGFIVALTVYGVILARKDSRPEHAPAPMCEHKLVNVDELKTGDQELALAVEANRANVDTLLQLLQATAKQWGSRRRVPTGLRDWRVVDEGELRGVSIEKVLND